MRKSPISGMIVETSLGKYSLSCRVGSFCEHDLNRRSNQLHKHNSYEILVVTNGYGTLIYSDKEYSVSKGDLIIIDPFVMHELRARSKGDFETFYFFLQVHATSGKSMSQEDKIVEQFLEEHGFYASNQFHILTYFDFLQSYYHAKPGHKYALFQTVKNILLESLLALTGKTDYVSVGLSSSSTFDLALDYIDQHLNDKITVDELAKHVCTSVRNLQFIFSRQLNQTIVGYINERKINLAEHYLNISFSVSETAEQLGMSSVSQFSRLFKKLRGISPKQFQQINIESNIDFGRRI